MATSTDINIKRGIHTTSLDVIPKIPHNENIDLSSRLMIQQARKRQIVLLKP